MNPLNLRLLSISACALATLYATAGNTHAADSLRVSLSEVVVTGSNHPVGRNLIPYTVSVIADKELQSASSPQLLSALSGTVPGMFVTERGILGFGVSNNGGSGGIKIRGVGNNGGVLMMVDGQPQFAGIYSHHVADFYSKEYVSEVQVLRGPGSVLYGSNAMGGVINVITRDAPREGTALTLSSQYGSHDTWESSLTGTTRQGKLSALLSASYNRTDGTEKNFDFRQWEAYGKLGYDFSKHWKGRVDYTIMQYTGNDPIYPRFENPESTDIYHQHVTRGEASVTMTNTYASTNGSASVYYSYGNHFVDDPRHFHSLDDRFGVLLYQNLTPWQNAAMTLGFDFNSYSGKIPMSGGRDHTDGSMTTIDRKTITEYSPYLTLAQGFFSDRLIVNGGVRMANSDKFGTQWIPQGGIVANPGKGWTLKGSVAMGYRNPSFKELYLYKMQNPDLRPEKMMNYEISVSHRFSRHLSADLTGYYSEGSDMIQVIRMKNENTGKFYNKGIELALSSHPVDNLSLAASYSFLHTSLDNLTGAPRNQYFIGAEWKPLKKLTVNACVKAIGGLFVDDDICRQDYALFNMKLSYEIISNLNVFLVLDNITDTRYEINRGYTMPGFTAFGGFRLHIR